MRTRRRTAWGGAVLLVAGALAGCGPEQPWVNELVSTNAAGTAPADDTSWSSGFSPDGRYLAFESWASDLGAPSSGHGDVYLHELATGDVSLVSSTHDGTPADGRSTLPVFSGDGSRVVFTSVATDLVDGASTDGSEHLYIRDIASGTTSLVTVDAAGEAGTTSGVRAHSVSEDGNLVLFSTAGPGLVPEDTNRNVDLFLRDVAAGTTTLVSVNAGGTGPANDGVYGAAQLSPDGTRVAFSSWSTDLGFADPRFDLDVFVRDLDAGVTTMLTTDAAGTGPATGTSYVGGWAGDDTVLVRTDAADLGFVDENRVDDVVAFDVATGERRLVSADASGTRAANGFARIEAISADGERVAISTVASDLGPVDSPCLVDYGTGPYPFPCHDIYVRDLATGEATLVTRNPEGTDSSRLSGGLEYGTVSFSADGNRLAFVAEGRGLGPADANEAPDIYVHDLADGTTTLVSHRRDQGGSGNAGAGSPHISPDGRRVAYASSASDITALGNPSGHTHAVLATFEAADLGATLDAPATVPAGGTIDYTVSVTNAGPDTADDTQATLALPEGTTWASATGPCAAPSADQPRGVPCHLGTLEPGETAEATVTATVTAGAASDLTAYATADARPADTDRTDNTAEATTTVAGPSG